MNYRATIYRSQLDMTMYFETEEEAKTFIAHNHNIAHEDNTYDGYLLEQEMDDEWYIDDSFGFTEAEQLQTQIRRHSERETFMNLVEQTFDESREVADNWGEMVRGLDMSLVYENVDDIAEDGGSSLVFGQLLANGINSGVAAMLAMGQEEAFMFLNADDLNTAEQIYHQCQEAAA